MPFAEELYEFRHAVVREAAYQMQLPSERAGLHRAAFEFMHTHLDDSDRTAQGMEILSHIRATDDKSLAQFELEYLKMAARRATHTFQEALACELLTQICSHELASVEDRLNSSQELGGQLQRLGYPRDATDTLTAALELARKEAPAYLGQITAALAGIYMESGKPEQAREMFERAIAELRSSGKPRQLGIALTNRAILLRHLGDDVNVEALLNEALTIHRQTGHTRFEGLTLLALGGLWRNMSDDEQAEHFYLSALEVFRRTGDRPHEAQALGNLANVYLMTQRLTQAEQAYQEALGVMRELGHRRSEAILLGNMGQLLQRTGRLNASLRAGKESVAILESINDLMLLPAFRAMYASSLATHGDYESAENQLGLAVGELGESPSVSALDHVLPVLFRFRIAQAIGGYGPGRTPGQRYPSRLDDAADVLRQLRAARTGSHSGRTQVVDRNVANMAGSLSEVREALDKGISPVVFNNLNEAEASPQCRKAVLCRLKELVPEQLEWMES
ncbi:MAG: tetratricopeptide repeat protein, partial [Planctomycetes bacterium]|nr:tetratricopeptide repeat protein [Planctomycetota bacterium]